MAINAKGSVDVPLTIFGGLDDELSPADLPEGVSPDCQDVMFLPGNAFQRNGLARLYPGRPPTTAFWGMKYQQPNSQPLNLSLYSDGALESEDAVNDPGMLTTVGMVVPGAFGKGCNAFGRAYMAFSDLINGVDIPRQLTPEGYWDRVTQDGPGAPPAAAVDYTATEAITAVTPNGFVIAASTGIEITLDAGAATATATIKTVGAHGFVAGESVVIGGAARSLVVGTWTVQTVPSPTTFTISIPLVWITINAINRVSNVEEVASAIPHNLIAGDGVQVQGTADTSLSGAFTVTGTPTIYQWTAANNGTDTSPSPGVGAQFIPTSFAASGGGYVAATATVSFATLPANANVGDPFQIIGSEASDSTFPFDNTTSGNPQFWTIQSINGNDLTFSLAGWVSTEGDVTTTGGNATVGGLSSAGQYQCVVIFVTRNEAYTAPSAPLVFYSNGNAKFEITGIPIGPPNVIARLLGFTAAGGGNFFVLPASVTIPSAQPGAQQIVVPATLVPDNTSDSIILNLADNETLAGEGIDIPGNNLFAQQTLAPCLGFMGYASRLAAWGEYNKIPNLENPSFDGGYLTASPALPLGWSKATNGGSLIAAPSGFGFAWQIAGDGSGNKVGELTQPAYQDAYRDPIFEPMTQYTFGAWIRANADNLGGEFVCDLYSASLGVIASAAIPMSAVGAVGKFLFAEFTAKTGATIPADAIIRIYEVGLPSGATVTIDETMVIYTGNPRVEGMRLSYVNNPEAFDGDTGILAPEFDRAPVQCGGMVRDTLVFGTLNSGVHTANDQAGLEPSDWTVNTISMSVGPLGPYAMDAGKTQSGDSGEEFLLIAALGGLYIYSGGEIPKITQEIQNHWAALNPAAQQTTWVKSDTVNRRFYVGQATGTASAPNGLLMMDRQQLETAYQIASSPPVHISFTGKMICSDLTRKWSPWTVVANYAETLSVGGQDQVCFFGGNGEAPGNAPGFGNVYVLSPAKLSDDDYGTIQMYYTTYFFVSHEAAQTLGLSTHRNLYDYIAAGVAGVGQVGITPLVNNLSNPWPETPEYPLLTDPTMDSEWGLNVTGNRMAPRISVIPAEGETDTFLSITKLVASIKPDPISPVAGALG